MQVRRGVDRVEIWAPAKINLFFEVLGRRSDGLHEIETLMVPVCLYDTLTVADDPPGRVMFFAGWAAGLQPDREEFGDLPQGEQNICVRAVRLLAARAGVDRGAKLKLVKRIPAAAGLGGGSSDAAAALVGANLIWNLGWTTERLTPVAAELGSDVPFFLVGGAAICRGRGEKVQRVTGLHNLPMVVVRPPEGLSTAQVYRACQPGTPPLAVDPIVKAFCAGVPAAFGRVAPNRLLEAARRLSRSIDPLLERLMAEGCEAVGMSGSGTSCFAVCRTAREARRVASRLRASRRPVGRVWTVSSI